MSTTEGALQASANKGGSSIAAKSTPARTPSESARRKAAASRSDKVDRRKQRSDAAIKRAFAELLNEKDLGEITVKELAERAGIDRKTFYLRFNSLDDYFDFKLSEEMERVAEALAEVDTTGDGLFDCLQMFRVIEREISMNLDDRANIIRHVELDKVLHELIPILTSKLIEKNSLNLADELGPHLEMFVAFFVGGLLSMYHQWSESGDELPRTEFMALANAAITGYLFSLSEAAEFLDVAGKGARAASLAFPLIDQEAGEEVFVS